MRADQHLEFCDLTVEVALHEALPRPLAAMHLRPGTASAVARSAADRLNVAEVRCECWT